MIEAASLDERITRCEKILKGNIHSQVFAPLADALRLRGNLDQAFRICRQGLRTHPNYGAGHLVMAKISLDRKMYDWAEQELNEAVMLEGETRASEQLGVEIQIEKGELDQARRMLVKLKAIGGNPLYIQDIEGRIKRLAHKKEKSGQKTSALNAKDLPAAIEPPQIEEQPKSYTISQAMTEIAAMEGVTSILCAHPDGMVVEHRGDSGLAVEDIAALGVEIYRAAEVEDAVEYFGVPRQITVTTGNGAVIVLRLDKYKLVILCESTTNPGSMRLKLDDIADRLEKS